MDESAEFAPAAHCRRCFCGRRYGECGGAVVRGLLPARRLCRRASILQRPASSGVRDDRYVSPPTEPRDPSNDPSNPDQPPVPDTSFAVSGEIEDSLRMASADQNVKALLVDVDSGGGGAVAGLEIAAAIKNSENPRPPSYMRWVPRPDILSRQRPTYFSRPRLRPSAR